MFDEFKIKLTSRFMRNIVSRMITKSVYKKSGYKIDFHLNELDVNVIDGETTVSANVEIKLDSEEFKRIIKTLESQM